MNKSRIGSGRLLCRAVAAFVFVAVLFASGPVLAEPVPEEGKKSVAVLPWKVNGPAELGFLSGAVSEMLTSRLGSAEGAGVVRSDIMKGALSGYGVQTDLSTKAAGVGKKLGLDYVLYGSVTLLGESVSIDAKLLDVKGEKVTTHFSTGRGIDSIVAMADTVAGSVSKRIFPSLVPSIKAVEKLPSASKSVAAAATDVVPAALQGASVPALPGSEAAPAGLAVFSPATKVRGGEKFWKGPFMDGLYIAFASADLDSDGVSELFLLKGTSITVAVVRDGSLEVVGELKSSRRTQFIAIDTIDTDLDGVTEVYVSGVRGNNAESSTIEYDNGEYKIALKGLRRLFRAVEHDGKRLLLGQGYREADGFYGDIRLYEKEGAGLVDRGRLGPDLPKGVDLYRFAFIGSDTRGEKRPSLAALNGRGRLVIYTDTGAKGWQREWKSPEYYGGTLNYIDIDVDDNGAGLNPVPIESRFFYMDVDGNGSKEIVIKTGTPGGLGRYADVIRSYTDGTVLGVAWDGQFLTELWRTKKVSGHVADFFVEPDEGKSVTVWMLVAEGGGALFGKPKSYVLSYQLPL
jgi:TolB-like protein